MKIEELTTEELLAELNRRYKEEEALRLVKKAEAEQKAEELSKTINILVKELTQLCRDNKIDADLDLFSARYDGEGGYWENSSSGC